MAFGITPSKGKVEVPEKEEVYTKSKYVTLNCTITVPNNGMNAGEVIMLPKGWTLDNSFIIAANAKLIGKSGTGQWIDLQADAKEDTLSTAGFLSAHSIETYKSDNEKLFFNCDVFNSTQANAGVECEYKRIQLRLLIMRVD